MRLRMAKEQVSLTMNVQYKLQVTKIKTTAFQSQPRAPVFVFPLLWKVKGVNPKVGETLWPQETAQTRWHLVNMDTDAVLPHMVLLGKSEKRTLWLAKTILFQSLPRLRSSWSNLQLDDSE